MEHTAERDDYGVRFEDVPRENRDVQSTPEPHTFPIQKVQQIPLHCLRLWFERSLESTQARTLIGELLERP